jgi:hypothetical protein
MTGPSWTAPTFPLLPTVRRRSGRGQTGPHTGQHTGHDADVVPGLAVPGAATRAGRRGDGRGSRRTPAGVWLREHAWLLTVAGVAVVVLVCARVIINGAEPAWIAGAPVAATPVPTAPATTTAPLTAAPAANPTPTARRTARPPRKPPARPRTPRPTPSPVLLGPDNEVGLWLLLRRYCAEVQGAREARLRSGFSPAEDNWECRGRGDQQLIDMTAACRHAYGSGAFARYGDADSALSWRCYRSR